MTFAHQSKGNDDYEIVSFMTASIVFSAQMVVLWIFRSTLAINIIIDIRVINVYRAIRIIRIIRITRTIRVTRNIMVTRVIRTIKVFRVIRVS